MSNTHQIIEFYGFSFDERPVIEVRDFYKPTARSEKDVENLISKITAWDTNFIKEEQEKGNKAQAEIYREQSQKKLASLKQQLNIIKTFNNTIVVPGTMDIRLSKNALQRKAHDIYLKNKDKLINAKTIEIQGASFGGLNAFAFLAAISSDTKDGQNILNKITNIDLINPLPNIGQSRIGKLPAAGLWIAKAFTGNWGRTPSIKKYIQTIAQNRCRLENADVMHYYANNDSIINHTKEYNATMKERFKPMCKDYEHKEYNGGHNDKPIRMNIERLKNLQQNNFSKCNLSQFSESDINNVRVGDESEYSERNNFLDCNFSQLSERNNFLDCNFSQLSESDINNVRVGDESEYSERNNFLDCNLSQFSELNHFSNCNLSQFSESDINNVRVGDKLMFKNGEHNTKKRFMKTEGSENLQQNIQNVHNKSYNVKNTTLLSTLQ